MRPYVHVIALSTALLACDPGQEPDESGSESTSDPGSSEATTSSGASEASTTEAEVSAAGTESSSEASTETTSANESATTDTDPSSTSEGEQCPSAQSGIAATYNIVYTNFPEIEGDELVVPSLEGVRLETECTISQLAYADEQLELTVDCEVAGEGGEDEIRQVAVSTAAPGLPAGVTEGDNVRVFLWLFENQGGRAPRPQGRVPILSLNSRALRISDSVGPILVTGHGGSQGEFPPVTLDERLDCADVELCRGDPGVYAGHVVATSGTETQRIEIGESVTIAGEEARWRTTLFQSRIDASDCHGLDRGGFSLVREPSI